MVGLRFDAMRFIDNEGVTDPRLNLALEEYAVRNFDIGYDYFLLYTNTPSVIVGKHQNVLEETDHEFVREREIQVVRRISGGGAVYHDPGNLNFSFITQYDRKKYNRYDFFLQPIIEALGELGVTAMQDERNGLLVDGRKISGNAQFTSRDRMMSHGTLLFDSDLDVLNTVLSTKLGILESRGVQSVRSVVTNILEHLDVAMTAEEFREKVREYVMRGSREGIRTVTEQEWEKIQELAESKYSTWEWNYARSPRFTIEKSLKVGNGVVTARIGIADGKIEMLIVEKEDGVTIEFPDVLVSQSYTAQAVQDAVNALDPAMIPDGLTKEELIRLLY